MSMNSMVSFHEEHLRRVQRDIFNGSITAEKKPPKILISRDIYSLRTNFFSKSFNYAVISLSITGNNAFEYTFRSTPWCIRLNIYGYLFKWGVHCHGVHEFCQCVLPSQGPRKRVRLNSCCAFV